MSDWDVDEWGDDWGDSELGEFVGGEDVLDELQQEIADEYPWLDEDVVGQELESVFGEMSDSVDEDFDAADFVDSVHDSLNMQDPG